MSTSTTIMLALKASLMLMVLGIGLQSTMRDASYLARHPGQLARSFLAMSVLMPLLAVGLATTFALTPAVSFALVALTLVVVLALLVGAIASMPFVVWSGRRRRPSSNAPRGARPAEFETDQGQRRAKAPAGGKQPRRE
jgi:predicted Na+-dependent transporter